MQVKEGNRNLNTSTKVASIRVEFQIYDFWSLHKLYLILHKSLEICLIFLVIYIKYLFNNYYEFFSLYLIFYGFRWVQLLGKLRLLQTTHFVDIDRCSGWRWRLRWYVWFHACLLNYRLILFVIYLIIESNTYR